MWKRVYASYEKALGSDRPQILANVQNLGILCRDQRKLDEAEVVLRRELVGREKALGRTIWTRWRLPGISVFFTTTGTGSMRRR